MNSVVLQILGLAALTRPSLTGVGLDMCAASARRRKVSRLHDSCSFILYQCLHFSSTERRAMMMGENSGAPDRRRLVFV